MKQNKFVAMTLNVEELFPMIQTVIQRVMEYAKEILKHRPMLASL